MAPVAWHHDDDIDEAGGGPGSGRRADSPAPGRFRRGSPGAVAACPGLRLALQDRRSHHAVKGVLPHDARRQWCPGVSSAAGPNRARLRRSGCHRRCHRQDRRRNVRNVRRLRPGHVRRMARRQASGTVLPGLLSSSGEPAAAGLARGTAAGPGLPAAVACCFRHLMIRPAASGDDTSYACGGSGLGATHRPGSGRAGHNW
jgi:hypothetical protein